MKLELNKVCENFQNLILKRMETSGAETRQEFKFNLLRSDNYSVYTLMQEIV